jgi:sarcosine oxidase subunit alpha
VQTDIAVIGGGPAGISAAIAAAGTGASVVVIDEGNELGGHLRWNTNVAENPNEFAGMRAFQVAKKLADQSVALHEIKAFAPATAFGVFSEDIMAVETVDGLIEIKPRRYVFGTGWTDRLPVFENNDLPGIITKTSAQVLMHLFGIRPGNDAAVYCNSDDGFALASQLLDAGVRVKAVVDVRQDASQSKMVEPLTRKDVPVYFNGRVVRASGRIQLDSIEITMEAGQKRNIPCDILCCAVGRQAVCELAQQAGCELRYDPVLRSVTATHDDHMQSTAQSYVAGEMLGTEPLAMIMLEGRLAGLSAALSVGLGGSAEEQERAELMTRVLRNRRS